MLSEKKWYAVYTCPASETKVSRSLNRKNFETYLPLNRSKYNWQEMKNAIVEPLFPCIIFVYVTEDDHNTIRRLEGVYQILHWLDKPAVIRSEEITMIKSFLKENINVKLEKIDVSVNDKARVIAGPLMLRDGNLLEVKNNSVKAILPSMGYMMIAELGKGVVEILHPVSPNKEYNY